MKKKMITDPMGQWKHPGKNTRIPSNNITMKGVNYPVLGVSNNGQEKMMYPGQDYTFPGADYVDEFPQMKRGGEDIPVIEDAGSYNKEGFWIPDWNIMTEQAKKLNAKTVKTRHGSMIYFDDNWNVKSVDDNPQMKRGGRPRGLVPMPKPSKKGLASKKYSRSLDATNFLFTRNPLFKKPKSRKNKVYHPYAKYYQDGGEPPYNNLPPTYLTALRNFIYPNISENPELVGYDPVNSTINYDSQSPIENVSNDWWREHELFHDLQNQAGGMSTLGIVGQRPNPYAASDDALQGYYNRRDTDVERTIDSMIAQDPNLQFIPREKLAQSNFDEETGEPIFIGAEDLQYADPSTLEGEARQYEQYIREGNPSIFPKKQNGGDTLPDDYSEFEKFSETLPSNLQDPDFEYGNPDQYNLYGMWETVGKPKSFQDVQDSDYFPLQDDGTYHGFTVGSDGEFLKPMSHGTTWKEVMNAHLNTDPYFQQNRIIKNEQDRLQYIPKEKDGGPPNFNIKPRLYTNSNRPGSQIIGANIDVSHKSGLYGNINAEVPFMNRNTAPSSTQNIGIRKKYKNIYGNVGLSNFSEPGKLFNPSANLELGYEKNLGKNFVANTGIQNTMMPGSYFNPRVTAGIKYGFEDGGYVDLELDDDEIKQYVDGGYVVEEVDDPAIPQLSRFNPGGSPCPRGQMRDASGKCVNYSWGSGNIQAADSYAGMYGGYDSSGVKNLSQVQATAKKGKKLSDYILRGGKSRADVARNLGKNAGQYFGMPGEALEPVNYTKAGLDKYTADIKNAKKNYEAKEKDYQNYLKAKEKASKGKMDTGKYARQFDEKGWAQYDVNTKEGSGPGADYSAKEARQNWGDPEEWKKFTGLVSNAATSIPLLGAAGAAGTAGAALLENPVVQGGLTAYGAYDAATNTLPEAYKDFSEGRYLEGAGNVALGALDFVPGVGLASKGAKLGAKGIKGAVNYGNDVIQTSKQAGKFALPKYKNVYRVEHADFNQAANADDLTGRWFADNPIETKFYAQNLKDPVTGEVIKDAAAPTRVMQQRLPEYKVKQNFGAGMPEEARMMSMGRGDFTNTELDELLGAGAGDRFTKGRFTESDLNAMETAPFLFRKEEGILDADMVNKLRGKTNAGRFSSGKSTVFDSQDKAIDYLFDEGAKAFKPKSKFSEYLPFKEGGALQRFTNGGGPGDDLEKNLQEVTIYDPKTKKEQLNLFEQLRIAKEAYQNYTKQNKGKKWTLNAADPLSSSISDLKKQIKLYKDEFKKEKEETERELKRLESLKKKDAFKNNKDIQNLTLKDLSTVKGKAKLLDAVRNSNLSGDEVAALYKGYGLDAVDPNVKQGKGPNAVYSAKEAEAAAMKDVPQFVDMVSKVATAIPLVGAAGAVGPAAQAVLGNPYVQGASTAYALQEVARHPMDTIEGVGTTLVEGYDLVTGREGELNRFGEEYGQGLDELANLAIIAYPGLKTMKAARNWLKNSKEGFNFAKTYIKPLKDKYKIAAKSFSKFTDPALKANLVKTVATPYAKGIDYLTDSKQGTQLLNEAGKAMENMPDWAQPTVKNLLRGYTLTEAGENVYKGTDELQEGLSNGSREEFRKGLTNMTNAVVDLTGVLSPANHAYNLTTPLNVIARGEEIYDDVSKDGVDAGTAFSLIRLINSMSSLPTKRADIVPINTKGFKGFNYLKPKHVKRHLKNTKSKLPTQQKGGIVTTVSNKEIQDYIKRGYIVEELD